MYIHFVKWIGIATGVAWLLLILPLYYLGEAPIVWAAILGCALPALCFLLGFYAICRAFRLPFRKLMIAIYGGMLTRLFVIGGILVLIVKLTHLPVASFLMSLFGFYFLYMAIELYFVYGQLPQMKEQQR
jgi:hypothetical protein